MCDTVPVESTGTATRGSADTVTVVAPTAASTLYPGLYPPQHHLADQGYLCTVPVESTGTRGSTATLTVVATTAASNLYPVPHLTNSSLTSDNSVLYL
jgi:hypothetical protein